MISFFKKILSKVIKFSSQVIRADHVVKETQRTELFFKHREMTYGDQKGQVDFLINNILDYSNNGLPFEGYFVDLACADGVEINNTYFLEKYLGWRGLLFEANSMYFETIENFRINPLVKKCVTDKVGEKVTFRVDDGMSGGIVSKDTDNNLSNRSKELKLAKTVTMETTTLEFELDLAGAPCLIDFMSLDIEGAEWLALKDFPFWKYTFKSMVIERPSRELDILLARNGYRQVKHLSYDVFYVHKDFLDSVNHNPKMYFSFTPRKDF